MWVIVMGDFEGGRGMEGGGWGKGQLSFFFVDFLMGT